MSEIITAQGRSSNTIAAEIVAITNQARQMAVMAAIEVGKRLVEAKGLVGHGEWGAYVERECLMSHRSANNCMKLFREWEQNPNSQALANLSYTNAVRLLALPEEDREELMENNDLANMSSRDLEAKIKELQEAKSANESLEADNLELQQKLLDAEQRVAAAKSSEDAWQAEIDKLNAALTAARDDATKAKNQVQYLRDHPEIPQKEKDKLQKDAREQGAKDAEKKLQAQLAEAQKKVEEATRAREAAEKAVQDLQQRQESARKSEKLADEDVAAINILSKQMAETFNKINGHLLKLDPKDPALAKKLRTVIADFGVKVKEVMSA